MCRVTRFARAAILIGLQFYPVFELFRAAMDATGNPFGGKESDLGQRVMIWGVIFLMAGALYFLRMAGVAGTARRAIRKYLGS